MRNSNLLQLKVGLTFFQTRVVMYGLQTYGTGWVRPLVFSCAQKIYFVPPVEQYSVATDLQEYFNCCSGLDSNCKSS